MKWFKHDSDANMDAKLGKLGAKYGLEGYGLYWFCLELIARNVEKHNLTFELEHDSELISRRWGIHQDIIQEMMCYMVDLDLFESSNGVITCLKMASRTDEYTQKVIKHTRVVGTLSGQNPRISELREEKRTEEKRKEKKVNSHFTPPTLLEVTEYCHSRKNGVDPEKFIAHYEANGWIRGKTKIKSWKACVRTWEMSVGQKSVAFDPTEHYV